MSGSPLPKRNNRNLALLLSGLVFPGSGHFVLGHKIRGAIFVLPTLAANVFMLRDVMARADQLVDQINSGALPLDPDTHRGVPVRGSFRAPRGPDAECL